MLKGLLGKENGFSSTEKGLVKKVEKAQAANGKPYYKVTVCDRDTDLPANVFDKDDILELVGKVVELRISIRNGFTNFDDIRELPGEDPANYKRRAPISPDGGVAFLYRNITLIKDDALRCITEYLLKENEEKFKTYAAGKSMHHDCLQGLLYHVSRMLVMAMNACNVYTGLDKDLMISGTILHDIGKVQELETDEWGDTTYTVDGNLFGHLLIGTEMVEKACRALGIDPGAEKVRLLRHMIASHHGKLEYGAVRPPATPEAFILRQIHDMDAKMWMYETSLGQLEPGQTTEKTVFGLGARVYKAEKEEGYVKAD